VITAWSVLCAILIFYPLKLTGNLRVSRAIEIRGLDEVFHGGLGYNI